MGSRATFLKVFKPDPPRRESAMFEITDNNGCILCNDHYLPEEVLLMILSYLSPGDLVFICRRVCRYWCNLIDSQVLKLKASKNKVLIQKINTLPWFACFWIVSKSPLGRNLVKNNCGQENLKHWEILSSGGDGWITEKPPVGSEDFPNECGSEDVLEHNSCFSTSYSSCTKRQLIDLRKEGAVPEFMDIVQPRITVADWYCGRFDCAAVYHFEVRLLNKDHELLYEFQVREHVGSANGWAWQKVSHDFHGYGPGVAYVEFLHGGVDSQFWKGHYGSKMTGASVVLSV